MQCWRHEQKCEHEKTEKEAVYEITEDNRFSCIKCKETFAFTPGVFKHVKEGRCENKSKKVAKEHKCTICDKIFDRESRLIKHQKVHTKDPFKCIKCLQEFLNKSSFMKHEKLCRYLPCSTQDMPGCSVNEKLSFVEEEYPSFVSCLVGATALSHDELIDDGENPGFSGGIQSAVPNKSSKLIPDTLLETEHCDDPVDVTDFNAITVEERDQYSNEEHAAAINMMLTPKSKGRMRQRKKRSIDMMVTDLKRNTQKDEEMS